MCVWMCICEYTSHDENSCGQINWKGVCRLVVLVSKLFFCIYFVWGAITSGISSACVFGCIYVKIRAVTNTLAGGAFECTDVNMRPIWMYICEYTFYFDVYI